MNESLRKGCPSPDIRVGEVLTEQPTEFFNMGSENSNKFELLKVKFL